MAKLSDLPKIVAEALQSEEILDRAGKVATAAIPKRTRLGKGVKENLGPTHKLPKLRETTVNIRKKLKKEGGLTGPGATPGKSAINRTGEALNSIDYSVKGGELNIFLDSSQEKKVDDLIAIDNNYSFMKLSRAEFRAVLKTINERLDRIIKKIRFTDL